MEYLEGALRELFGVCAGFRQMSFRPKANGPMCFVEVGCFASFLLLEVMLMLMVFLCSSRM
jgi:hypothetical protein